MGSTATGISTGGPVAASPLETSAILLCLELENDASGGDACGGTVGKLQVKLMVPFLLLFLFFFKN